MGSVPPPLCSCRWRLFGRPGDFAICKLLGRIYLQSPMIIISCLRDGNGTNNVIHLVFLASNLQVLLAEQQHPEEKMIKTISFTNGSSNLPTRFVVDTPWVLLHSLGGK